MSKERSVFQQFRKKTYIVIYGTNTIAGKAFDLILLGVILLSILLTMMETVKSFETKYHDIRIALEWGITIFFTIEYFLRIISINKPLKYIFSFYGIIDLIATLPMYLAQVFAGSGVLSIVRSLRLLRLFKVLNHPQFTGQSQQLKDALLASKGKILVFIYFVLISTVLIGSIMYVVEGRENGFTSIPTSIYWTIVTLTTVGYGDISPVTPLGQFLASLVMILGYGVIAVPTGIVSAELAKTDQKLAIIDKNPCADCGAEGHQENAKFCHQCGNNLLDD
ncbi:ion transporter [Flavobacterium sp. NRK F7]|uniref:ion transporter n=1 Tax=Flavobacterium sp. NRK F7 TaxID=2954930 RepID=UPI00209129A9|nr:ion transporter [Flavobacterium sp. NRK F7]MCO6162837.1 ion transporter [Flavobacterium sp. NRK F7]